MADISAYLPTVMADYTREVLTIKPQKTMVITGEKNQVVHTFDDASVSVVTLSESFFVATLQWAALSAEDAQTITDIYHDPEKANGLARTFYMSRPRQESEYPFVCRFLSNLPGVYTGGKPNSEGINQIKIRIEGVAPEWYDWYLYINTALG